MTSKIWGGRFQSATDAVLEAINVSIDFDKRLGPQDIRGSLAHVAMLGRSGDRLARRRREDHAGTDADRRRNRERRLHFLARARRHSHERRVAPRRADRPGGGAPAHRALAQRSGGDRFPPLRPRRRSTRSTRSSPICSSRSCERARGRGRQASCPASRICKRAQPVTFGHHLLAYVEMIGRDRGRLPRRARAAQRMSARRGGARRHVLPDRPRDDGDARSASTGRRPIRSTASPIATSCWRRCAAAAICATHLSRFAEEIVLWTTPQFGFIALSDKFTTGSSIMPQKRNPDAAELVRGKSGRVIGALVRRCSIVMKGLPLAYSKDMQEDKEGAFDALDTLLALHRRHGRHGPRHASRPRADEGRGRRGLSPPRPTSPTGWCAALIASVPRGASCHRPHRRARRRARRRS